MQSNPVILYSPNSTVITTQLVQKVNSSFQLIDEINSFCRSWLKFSPQLVEKFRNDSFANQTLARVPMLKRYVSSNKYSHKKNNTNLLVLLDRVSNRSAAELIKQIEMIDNAACSWLSIMKDVNLNLFKGFANESDLVDYFLNKAYSDNVTVIASLVFQLNNSANEHKLDKHITYKIRQNASFTYTTKKVRERYWYPSPRDWDYYYYVFGFVWLQDLIDRAIIDYHSNQSVLEPGTYLNQMPYPCYMIDNFLQMIQHVIPLCLCISFVYTVSMLSQTIVYEKELRLKEVMKIMGLNKLVHLFARFITYFLQFLQLVGQDLRLLVVHVGIRHRV
jgi:ATP-binding cassette subfamily A (ABC1) protein 2